MPFWNIQIIDCSHKYSIFGLYFWEAVMAREGCLCEITIAVHEQLHHTADDTGYCCRELWVKLPLLVCIPNQEVWQLWQDWCSYHLLKLKTFYLYLSPIKHVAKGSTVTCTTQNQSLGVIVTLTKYSSGFFVQSVQDKNFLKNLEKITYQGSKDIRENVNI